jgi:hypothetical protein
MIMGLAMSGRTTPGLFTWIARPFAVAAAFSQVGDFATENGNRI